MKILALDLGKFKAVGCVYGAQSQATEYAYHEVEPCAHRVINGDTFQKAAEQEETLSRKRLAELQSI